jgi:hypothetical protein
MPVDTASVFSQVIDDHIELKRRNAELEPTLPIDRYVNGDPFENHPLFKTEEQARIEDTMDGVVGIESHVTSLDWPTADDTFLDQATLEQVDQPTEPHEAVSEEQSDETLWTRSRDFDWGD